jgi:hypothetical protein
MSKRHQASRRRTYGRRQHEIRERIDRAGGWDVEPGEMPDDGRSGVDDGTLELERPVGLRAGWMGAS